MHAIGLLSLILSIRKNSNWVGVSYKTMEILLVWYWLRYSDLIFYINDYYMIVMKILFISMISEEKISYKIIIKELIILFILLNINIIKYYLLILN